MDNGSQLCVAFLYLFILQHDSLFLLHYLSNFSAFFLYIILLDKPWRRIIKMFQVTSFFYVLEKWLCNLRIWRWIFSALFAGSKYGITYILSCLKSWLKRLYYEQIKLFVDFWLLAYDSCHFFVLKFIKANLKFCVNWKKIEKNFLKWEKKNSNFKSSLMQEFHFFLECKAHML